MMIEVSTFKVSFTDPSYLKEYFEITDNHFKVSNISRTVVGG